MRPAHVFAPEPNSELPANSLARVTGYTPRGASLSAARLVCCSSVRQAGGLLVAGAVRPVAPRSVVLEAVRLLFCCALPPLLAHRLVMARSRGSANERRRARGSTSSRRARRSRSPPPRSGSRSRDQATRRNLTNALLHSEPQPERASLSSPGWGWPLRWEPARRPPSRVPHRPRHDRPLACRPCTAATSRRTSTLPTRLTPRSIRARAQSDIAHDQCRHPGSALLDKTQFPFRSSQVRRRSIVAG